VEMVSVWHDGLGTSVLVRCEERETRRLKLCLMLVPVSVSLRMVRPLMIVITVTAHCDVSQAVSELCL
jgi:hypothetical protein